MSRWFLLPALWFSLNVGGLGAPVGRIAIKGPIGPATADYIARSLDVAAGRRFECLVIQLDTPGGLLDSTKTIVQELFASKVPTVVYVAPAGATASSAGCFITLAAHVAAMDPSSSIGAAHPVMIGGGGEQGTNSAMNQKLENFASSFIETIATRRHRNAEWAIQSVRASAAITAEQALRSNIVDIVADDLPSLLAQLDGRTVEGRTLKTSGAQVTEIPMLLRERVFQMFWRPEVMMILMLVAVYGIIGELGNPGAIVPGVVGVIALVLALYMMAVLPVNLAGVLLIVLAIGLFTAEAFTPSFGLLTVGGVAAFIVGALMLFDPAVPAFRLSLKFILPLAILTAVFFLFVIGVGLRAQWLPVRVGRETLIGQTPAATTPIGPDGGWVFVEGESWQAVSDTPVAKGQHVEVVSVDGLTLRVKPKT